MTEVTNAFQSYNAKGNREDLSDFIWDISPTDTPFQNMIPKTNATATKHEWQTDSLDAASPANQQLEGDAIDAAAATATTRLDNQCQISYKAFAVTGTQESVLKAGRKSELKYQALKASKALKRDMEAGFLANNAKVTRASSTNGELAGVEAWIATNTSRGSGGTDPAGTGADTAGDGTQRDFAEDKLKETLRECFDAGGDPDCIMVGPKHKQDFSTFTGNATRFKTAEDKQLVATIDVYQSDFGDLQVLPNRFIEGFTAGGGSGIRSALVIQKDMWAVANLRAPHLEDLARTGDAERRYILWEGTLEARNEAANGIIADLNY